MSLLMDEKRYVLEAYLKCCETEKEDAMNYKDWIFDYFFSGFEVENAKEKESQA